MIERVVTVGRIRKLCWVCLATFSVIAGFAWSWHVAVSVIAGGLVSVGSFYLASRDMGRLTEEIAGESDLQGRQALAHRGQRGYLIRSMLRIVIIGVVLLLLVKVVKVNVLGMVLGLSTVVLAIGLVGLDFVWHHFSSGRR